MKCIVCLQAGKYIAFGFTYSGYKERKRKREKEAGREGKRKKERIDCIKISLLRNK